MTQSPEGNRTSLGGGSATLDMSSGFGVSRGHCELLPDGRMAFIMPSNGNTEALATVPSATYAPLANTSRRAGGFFQMIAPLQFQFQNAPGWPSQLNGWSSTNSLAPDPVQTSYSHTSDAAFLNNLEFQNAQLSSFGDAVPGMNTQLPIPPGPSATYEPQGNQVYSNNWEAIAPTDLLDDPSFHLASSLQQNGPTMNPRVSDTFGAELEALQSEDPFAANFVPDWDYRSRFY
jgi:hypothetical protein